MAVEPAGSPDGETVTVIADLHLSFTWDGHGAGEDDLTGFLDDLRQRALEARGRRLLLLLGDILDFPRAPGGAPLERLERLAAEHGRTLASLARLAAAGVEIALVPGNHDMEWMRGELRTRLVTLLAEAGAGDQARVALSFRPWFVHLPGVLYAEHGQQHHDLNRFPMLLGPYIGADDIVPPPGLCLDEFVIERRARYARSELRFTRRLARSLLAMSRAERRRGRAAYERDLRAHAAETGLDEDTLVALHRLSAVSPGSLPRRALRRALERRLGDPEPYMVDAARSVHRRLAAAGRATPFYVFAHTHAPADAALGSAAGAPRYLNPGSWAWAYPPASQPIRRRLPFVEVTRAAGESRAAGGLFAWDAIDCRRSAFA